MVANFMKIRAGKPATQMNGIIDIHDCAVKPCDTFKANCALRHGLRHLHLVNRWPQYSEMFLF